MTETEWMTCNDPGRMLEFTVGLVSRRKLRLAGCACGRRVWRLIGNETHRKAVEKAELYADGMIAKEELMAAGSAAVNVRAKKRSGYGTPLAWAARGVVFAATATDRIAQLTHDVTQAAQHFFQAESGAGEAQRIVFADLLRDIVGNLFQPVEFSPEWRTDTAVLLARPMYESRDFSAMPILADALQDAGCDNDDILNHCRDTALTHVRGCWAIDLVLGKE